MAKQTQAAIDVIEALRENGYARTSDLSGYKTGKYSQDVAVSVLREFESEGLLEREGERAHTYYATDKLTEFKTASEVAEGDEQ